MDRPTRQVVMPKGKAPAVPFVKGDPRINRKGRPKKGETFAEYVRNFIESEDDAKKKAVIETMMMVAIKKANQGQFQFWDALVNRAYGKVPDKVETITEEKPDLSKLTKEELETWMQLLQKAKPSQ